MVTGKKTGVEEIKVEESDLAKFSESYGIALEAVKKKLAIKVAVTKNRLTTKKKKRSQAPKVN